MLPSFGRVASGRCTVVRANLEREEMWSAIIGCYAVGSLVSGVVYLICIARGLVRHSIEFGFLVELFHYGSRLLLIMGLWPVVVVAFAGIALQDGVLGRSRRTAGQQSDNNG